MSARLEMLARLGLPAKCSPPIREDVTSPFKDPLVELRERLSCWFASDSVTAVLTQMGITPPALTVSGYNQREQQVNQGAGGANRIILMPGSWPDGADQGELVEPVRRKGILHRVNATWRRVVTMSCWGVDTSNPLDTNPERQIQAVSSLMNTAHAGLRAVLRQDFDGTGRVFRDPKVSSGNQAFGQELLVQFSFLCEMRALPINVSGTPVSVVGNKPTD